MSDQRRAVLWDLDGTLIDSTEYHYLTWRCALEPEGFQLTREAFRASYGQRNDAVLRGFLGQELPMSEVARIGGAKEAHYRDLIRDQGIELLPGARRLLNQLHAAGWRQAIASSAPRENIEVVVATLGVAATLTAIVGAEDVRHGKPDPEVFLTSAARVEVLPAFCIVVEDAPAGVEAARRAGMRAVGVLTTHADLQADQVVRSLEELDVRAFERMLER